MAWFTLAKDVRRYYTVLWQGVRLRWWRGGSVPFGFEYQHHNKPKDDQEQKEDAFPFSGAFLVSKAGETVLSKSLSVMHDC